MSIVAFCGQKGGTGKTTTAISVVAELLARENRVLLVDADPQGTSRTWVDVATEEGQPVPHVVKMGADMHVRGRLDAIAKDYDYTIIDCPPSNGDVQKSALMICTLALMPCGPGATDVWSAEASVELLKEAQKLRPELMAAAFITRKKGRTTIGGGARKALDATGVRVLRSELEDRVVYTEFPASGKGVAQYAPTDQASAELKALVAEILEELDKAPKPPAHDRAPKRAKKAIAPRSTNRPNKQRSKSKDV